MAGALAVRLTPSFAAPVTVAGPVVMSPAFHAAVGVVAAALQPQAFEVVASPAVSGVRVPSAWRVMQITERARGDKLSPCVGGLRPT
jgi:hypothetical protein